VSIVFVGIAQLAERNLAKVEVAGSIPAAHSTEGPTQESQAVLKTVNVQAFGGSIPSPSALPF
jgi:hypothetical protein